MWELYHLKADLHAPIFFTFISEAANKHLKWETNSYEYF